MEQTLFLWFVRCKGTGQGTIRKIQVLGELVANLPDGGHVKEAHHRGAQHAPEHGVVQQASGALREEGT